jgi:DNA processing protein
VRGNLDLLHMPCVAIVGTRRATPYAERVARELGRTLARAGACVVSGLARGVDSAAHRGALDVNGATCAVLGTGLDVVYPKGNAALQKQISEQGLVLSELRPDDRSNPGSFVERNRIIAALSKVTIVVEAPEKSGALKTADFALELNRTLAAVPGPIDIPQALKSNELIRDGATPITTMADALALMGLTQSRHLSQLPREGNERLLWDALASGAAPLDALCARTGLPANEAMSGVSTLEVLGFVECSLTGDIRRI